MQLAGISEKMIFYLLGRRNLSVDPPSLALDFWASKESFLMSYFSIEVSILEVPFKGSKVF